MIDHADDPTPFAREVGLAPATGAAVSIVLGTLVGRLAAAFVTDRPATATGRGPWRGRT